MLHASWQTGGYTGLPYPVPNYSMFYCAQAMLLTKGLAFSKHAGVIAAFGKSWPKRESCPLSTTGT